MVALFSDYGLDEARRLEARYDGPMPSEAQARYRAALAGKLKAGPVSDADLIAELVLVRQRRKLAWHAMRQRCAAKRDARRTWWDAWGNEPEVAAAAQQRIAILTSGLRHDIEALAYCRRRGAELEAELRHEGGR